MPLFSNEQVTPHLKRILLPCGVCAYLARGERRAVLIDTGFGLGDLKSYVESLVTTPYMGAGQVVNQVQHFSLVPLGKTPRLGFSIQDTSWDGC